MKNMETHFQSLFEDLDDGINSGWNGTVMQWKKSTQEEKDEFKRQWSKNNNLDPVNDFFGTSVLNARRDVQEAINAKRGENMVWNYEKGCEEAVAYPSGSNVYTPPKWKNNAASACALKWEEAEAKSHYYRNTKITGVKEHWDKEAATRWYELEKTMLWGQASQMPDFRRRYIEWLSKATEMDVQLGITDLAIDELPMMERIIAVGYRTLAKAEHPDLGGTPERFQKLKETKEKLDQVMKEVKDLL